MGTFCLRESAMHSAFGSKLTRPRLSRARRHEDRRRWLFYDFGLHTSACVTVTKGCSIGGSSGWAPRHELVLEVSELIFSMRYVMFSRRSEAERGGYNGYATRSGDKRLLGYSILTILVVTDRAFIVFFYVNCTGPSSSSFLRRLVAVRNTRKWRLTV